MARKHGVSKGTIYAWKAKFGVPLRELIECWCRHKICLLLLYLRCPTRGYLSLVD
jgi:hypothetical protein